MRFASSPSVHFERKLLRGRSLEVRMGMSRSVTP